MKERSEISKVISRYLIVEATTNKIENEISELTRERVELNKRSIEIEKRLQILESEIERYIRDFNYERRK